MRCIVLAIAALTFVACAAIESEPSVPSASIPMDISDQELRAAFDALDWVTIRTEQGTGIHNNTIFVLATWLDDQVFAQWNLGNDKVTKVVIFFDPDDTIEPFLMDYQITQMEALTGLVAPGWDDVTEWLFGTWGILAQQETETPSATQRYRNIHAKATVYTATNIGVVEFTAYPNR